MLIFHVVSNVDLLCRSPMLFLMLIFNVDFWHWFSLLIFNVTVFPNVVFRINFSYVFLLLNYNFALVDRTLFFFFLPFPRFRYLFSNNFLLNIILYLFFLFLSLMFFCFFLFFTLSSQNRTYFTMITLGHHTSAFCPSSGLPKSTYTQTWSARKT